MGTFSVMIYIMFQTPLSCSTALAAAQSTRLRRCKQTLIRLSARCRAAFLHRCVENGRAAADLRPGIDARCKFGSRNPKSQLFRHWVLTRSEHSQNKQPIGHCNRVRRFEQQIKQAQGPFVVQDCVESENISTPGPFNSSSG